MKKVLVLYWSQTGNTKKTAYAVKEGIERTENQVEIKNIKETNSDEVDFFDYNLICVGTPSYQWRPPEPAENFLQEKFNTYRDQGYVKLGAPRRKGKYALVFCTYSGPHTGKNEAVPAAEYVSQFFDHLGFEIVDKWYILGEFHGSKKNSTKGRMGDIRGLPSEEDLEEIRDQAQKMVINLEK